jgi:hypothetical protein
MATMKFGISPGAALAVTGAGWILLIDGQPSFLLAVLSLGGEFSAVWLEHVELSA